MGNISVATLAEETQSKPKHNKQKPITPIKTIKSSAPSRKPLNNQNENLLIPKKMEKCCFVRIPPVKLQQDPIMQQQIKSVLEIEEKDLEDNAKNQNARKNKTKQVRTQIQLKQMSLQQILKEQAEEPKNERIPVNWYSFVKIKKKNYLEDYIHIKQIGQGAYGSVSKIQMKYGGLLRAAKIIKCDRILKKKNKFVYQITIPMKTDHPNLNKLFQVFEWKKNYVLIMQLCEGGDLFSRIKGQKSFSESKIADIMKQILSGVVYLHKNNIAHRDLKPENMLYDNEGKLIKITDFGSATEIPKSKKMKTLVGSPYYIAPQVILGQYTEKCDVWSCGVILYILLCGSPPFFGGQEEEIMRKIVSFPVKFEGVVWSKRSKQSKMLIGSMLNKNYEERPSASEVLNSEWIKNSIIYDSDEVGEQFMKNLSGFHFQNRLKAVVYTYIASQLFSSKDKQSLMKIFKEMDKDGDGVIAKEELLEVFKKHKGEKFTQIDAENIVNIVDTNGSGLIDFTQFLVAASDQEQLLQKRRLQNAFSYLDSDHSGYITAEEVLPFLDQSSEAEMELKKIFEDVDVNGDGKISKKQFVALLLRKN